MGILKNSTIIVAGVIISNLFAYVFHIYVGRSLGAADYGVFGVLMSLFLIIALPAGALSSAVTKYTSSYYANEEYEKVRILRKNLQKVILVFGGATFILIFIFSQSIASYLKISSIWPIVITGLVMLASLILPLNRGLLQGMKKYKQYSLNSIWEAITRLILAALLIYSGFGVNGALIAYGLGYFVAFLLIFHHIKVQDQDKSKKEELEMKKIYYYIGLVLFVNLIIQSIINVPSIFIKHYFSSEFTGLWTAALTLARMSLFVAGGISLVMFSEVSGSKDKQVQKRIFKKTLFLTLLGSALIAIFFYIFSGIIIHVLYGPQFLGAAPLLEYMALAMIPLAAFQLWVNYWLAKKKN